MDTCVRESDALNSCSEDAVTDLERFMTCLVARLDCQSLERVALGDLRGTADAGGACLRVLRNPAEFVACLNEGAARRSLKSEAAVPRKKGM